MTTEDYRQIVPLKWYKFLIYFQLFAGAIGNIAYAFNYFTGNNYGEAAEKMYATYGWLYLLDKVWGCVLILTGIFCFKVRQDLAKFRVKGPSRYLYLTCIDFFGSFIYTICFISITDTSMKSLVLIQSFINILVGVVYIYLNKAYFDNRKFLFTETKSMMNKSQKYDTYTDADAYTTNNLVKENKQNSNAEELKLLKAKKAISSHKDSYVITSIILYFLAFCTASIPPSTFILALSTPFIAHGIVNIKLKKETSESKIQICYYMSFIWKFYVIISVLLFSAIGIFIIVPGTFKWTNVLILFIPVILVLSLTNFLDSRWWKQQYRSAISESKLNLQESKKTISEETNNKFLNSLTAQKERVKQQNTVANNKLTQNENPVEKIFCANCNKDLTNDIASVPGLMFCPYCDTPICLQSNQWTCSNCGKANPITVKFCKGCGTWVSAANEQVKEREPNSNSEEEIIQTDYNTKQCVKCGFELKNDAKFCIICGERQPEIKQRENKI